MGQVVACKATVIGNMAPCSSRASAGRIVPASRIDPRAMTLPSGRWMAEVATQSCGRVTAWARRVSAPITVLPRTLKPSTGASKVSLTPLGKLAPAASFTGADS